MANKLSNINVHEISAVDKAANLRTFLIRKSAARPNMKGATVATATDNKMMAFMKGLMGMMEGNGNTPADIAKNAVTLDETTCELSDALTKMQEAAAGDDAVTKAAATEELLEQFTKSYGVFIDQGLIKAFPLPAAGDKTPTPKKKPAPGDTPDPDAKDDKMGKSAEMIALEKRATDSETALTKMQADLTKEQDLRKDAEFLQKARDIGPVPGNTFQQTADLLKAVAGNEALFKQTEVSLKAAAAIAKTSDILKEAGTNNAGGVPTGSATQIFLNKAQEVATAQKIPIDQAMLAVAKSDPDLYNAHRSGAK
jgi:hypothetical protein